MLVSDLIVERNNHFFFHFFLILDLFHSYVDPGVHLSSISSDVDGSSCSGIIICFVSRCDDDQLRHKCCFGSCMIMDLRVQLLRNWKQRFLWEIQLFIYSSGTFSGHFKKRELNLRYVKKNLGTKWNFSCRFKFL